MSNDKTRQSFLIQIHVDEIDATEQQEGSYTSISGLQSLYDYDVQRDGGVATEYIAKTRQLVSELVLEHPLTTEWTGWRDYYRQNKDDPNAELGLSIILKDLQGNEVFRAIPSSTVMVGLAFTGLDSANTPTREVIRLAVSGIEFQ